MTPSRAGALAILLLLIAALWLGPVSAYMRAVGAGAGHVAAAEKTLAQFRALASAPQAADAAVDPAAVFYPERTDAEMVAVLQESLKSAAGTARVEIEGIQVLQPEPLAGARRIVVRLRGRADMPGLGQLLYAIEAARPVLYADNLQLLSRGQASAAAPTTLNFQIDVSGFTRGAGT